MLYLKETKTKTKTTHPKGPGHFLARVSETEDPQSCFPVCSIF